MDRTGLRWVWFKLQQTCVTCVTCMSHVHPESSPWNSKYISLHPNTPNL